VSRGRSCGGSSNYSSREPALLPTEQPSSTATGEAGEKEMTERLLSQRRGSSSHSSSVSLSILQDESVQVLVEEVTADRHIKLIERILRSVSRREDQGRGECQDSRHTKR
jgi:hypothetical protein